MRIGRKQALFAFVAGIVPWISRGMGAQVLTRPPVGTPTVLPTPAGAAQSVQLADLQRRIAALETRLANQVAFTRDASGNLTLRGDGNVTLDATLNLTFRGGSQAVLSAGGNTRITGATIALN